MQGILVVPSRSPIRLGSYLMGQDGSLDQETLNLINRASADQLIAIGKAISAAHVLVSRPAGRIITNVMVPAMKGLDALFRFAQHFGDSVPEALIKAREQSGIITNKSISLESALSDSKGALRSIANAIAQKDKTVARVSYWDPQEGYVNAIFATPGVDVNTRTKSVSLLVEKDMGQVKAAAEEGKKALEELGYSERMGWIVAAAIIVGLIVSVIAALTALISYWGDSKKGAQERIADRIDKANREISEVNSSIAFHMAKVEELRRIEKSRKLSDLEMSALSQYEAALNALEERKVGLIKQRDFLLKVGEDVRDADDMFSSLSRLLESGARFIVYMGAGLAALFVVGTIIHFTTE